LPGASWSFSAALITINEATPQTIKENSKSKAISRQDAKAQRKAKPESCFTPFFATLRLCAKIGFAFAFET
jgi:hypothetical protein